MDRRDFLSLTLSAALLPEGLTAHAINRSNLEEADDPATEDIRFRRADDLMVRGIRFERAAELLREVVRDFPESDTVRLALACACVSRVASLAYAAAFADALRSERATYPERFRQWQAKQAEQTDGEKTKSLEEENEKPQTPPNLSILIRDDKTPYRLRRDQLKTKVRPLREEALAQLKTVSERVKESKARANAAYLQAWCLRLLLEYGQLPDISQLSMDTDNGPQEALYPLPDRKETDESLRVATKEDPENPTYWRTLGDFLIAGEEAETAHQRSLDINPRQAILWFRLYDAEYQRSLPPLEGSVASATSRRTYSKEKARFYLEKATWADPANAYYLYELAYVTLKQTHFSLYALSQTREAGLEALRSTDVRKHSDEGISLVERGNSLPALTVPMLSLEPPRWLAVAYSYIAWLNRVFPGYTRLRELARGLGGIGIFFAREKQDTPTANRAFRAAIGMGLRMLERGDVPAPGDKDYAVLNRLVGLAIVSMTYKLWEEALQTSGDGQALREVRIEAEAFRAWSTDFRQRILDTTHSEHYTAYY